MPSDDPLRVYRGGCWNSAPASARVARRYWLAPGRRNGFLGVRMVREITVLLQLAEVKDAK